MQRETQVPRADWIEQVERFGFNIHHFDGKVYWAEDTAYRLSVQESDAIRDATTVLHGLCLAAVDRIITDYRRGDPRLIAHFSIPESFWPEIARSWEAGEQGVYGRFDLACDGQTPPKMLEYNADTPTSLMEAAVLQWYWLQTYQPQADQFNTIHEQLVARWGEVVRPDAAGTLPLVHFMGCTEMREDLITIEYMRDVAAQAGLPTRSIDISQVGYDQAAGRFVDHEGVPVRAAFKLYPWEHMARDDYGSRAVGTGTRWIEPVWKMLLSNKAILPVLWELNPGHPNLVRASFRADDFAGEDHVVKPKLSREGGNVRVVLEGQEAQKTTGIYDEKDCIWQAYAPLARFGDYRAVVGSWVVGDTACGMGIREDYGYVTANDSRFVPHYIQDV